MIKMKKTIKIITGILLVITLFAGVNAFSYTENEVGDSFYEMDDELRATSVTFKELLTIQPSSEPANPEIGMIYFDSNSKKLRLYDGTGWYSFSLEKVSTVSKKQVKEKIEKDDEDRVCEESIDCGDWGDCINNYQSMTCVTVELNCDRHENTETKDCVSDFELESAAKDSHDVEEAVEENEEEVEEIEQETEVEEEVAEELGVEVGDEETEEEEIPEELFDITFDLEENSLSKSDKLVLWSTLQNFGKKYVPARLIYSVMDGNGEEVYREFEEIRVYTDQSIIKRFDNLVLEEGEYVLFMKVEYAGIVEEFSDDFVVETGFFISIKQWFVGWF